MSKKNQNPPVTHTRSRNKAFGLFSLGSSLAPSPDPVQEMVADPLVWLQNHTRTKDSHWQEAGALSPYRPFPSKPYFEPIINSFQQEPVLFIEKSRDMMLSWLCVGLFTRAAMATPGIEILFQSQKEDKAFELVEYAKTLYDQQSPRLQQAFPLARPLHSMAEGLLEFANGSRIIGIPGGGDQIRSYHPWGLLQDEAAFMPEAGEAYDNAVPVCQKIIVLSSAGPGWFAEFCNDCTGSPIHLVPGLTQRRTRQGAAVLRLHYSADPERGPQWAAQERKKYSSQGAWDREQEIIHEAGGGERIFAEVFSQWSDRIIIDSENFQPSPYWKRIGGFDHGRANPTAALVGYVDFDGVIYLTGEYYQPGLSPRQHRTFLEGLHGFLQAEVYADPSIFYQTQAQGDGSFRAIAELYNEVGITHLIPAAQNGELLGMERILSHWSNLDAREPTLKIVCPRNLRDIQRPMYGLHNNGCPNLLWELRQARREELTATQLLHRNPTERIVDKNNHLRDCLKYLCLSNPEPPQITKEMRAQEAMKRMDATSVMAFFGNMAQKPPEPAFIPLGRRALYKMATGQYRHIWPNGRPRKDKNELPFSFY
ncbi:MAG TPA: hypothetical protein VG759_03010 [Candidatus Angelobacter sp.]|jgi:hypothetical protein|nr:hypothetical protein [Candidatus Angelobacter sp.]